MLPFAERASAACGHDLSFDGGDKVSTGWLKLRWRAEESWLASLIIREQHTKANEELALAA